LWVSMFDVFWVFFGVFVVVDGGFLASSSIVCVCLRVAWCVWYFYRRRCLRIGC